MQVLALVANVVVTLIVYHHEYDVRREIGRLLLGFQAGFLVQGNGRLEVARLVSVLACDRCFDSVCRLELVHILRCHLHTARVCLRAIDVMRVSEPCLCCLCCVVLCCIHPAVLVLGRAKNVPSADVA